MYSLMKGCSKTHESADSRNWCISNIASTIDGAQAILGKRREHIRIRQEELGRTVIFRMSSWFSKAESGVKKIHFDAAHVFMKACSVQLLCR